MANNYGSPAGAAETALGEILRTDFVGLRDKLLISTKAGYYMWQGPYGEFGSRKYLIASLDQSLQRLGLDYVDIFYSHRFDPNTPLEETMGALDFAVRSGRALYAGISSYNSHYTREAAAILKSLGTPCLIHQPSYSMVNHWAEQDDLLNTLDDLGIGSIAFTPLAQGLLSDKYLKTVPTEGRVTSNKDILKQAKILAPVLNKLNAMAKKRGQSLAQMALAWTLHGSLTSALIGASKSEQIIDCVGALKQPKFTNAELTGFDWNAPVDCNYVVFKRGEVSFKISFIAQNETAIFSAQLGQIDPKKDTELCMVLLSNNYDSSYSLNLDIDNHLLVTDRLRLRGLDGNKMAEKILDFADIASHWHKSLVDYQADNYDEILKLVGSDSDNELDDKDKDIINP